jgi:hypothetical protein
MALSARARSILEHMEPDRGYDRDELRAFAPDLTLENLHDVMRELWVERQVERFGYSGWRRHRSSSPAASHTARGPNAAAGTTASASRNVRPEDLFDHSEFEDMFK